MPGPVMPSSEPAAADAAQRTVRWYLESLVEGGRQLRRIGLHPLPFRVGRLSGLGLSLSSESVSKEHAELTVHDGSLRVRDLGSKNGTFVNGTPVRARSEVLPGDVVRFGEVEMIYRR
jgi:pSer/pThr/pTyr-binding forkhead associated (FHA) protein